MIEKAAAKLIAYAVLALLVVGLFFSWRSAAKSRDAAEAQAATLGASLMAHIENADKSQSIATAVAEKSRTRTAKVVALSEEVRRVAKPTTPPECLNAVADFLAPIHRQLHGLRRIEAESADCSQAPRATVLRRPPEHPAADIDGPERRGDLRSARAGGLPFESLESR